MLLPPKLSHIEVPYPPSCDDDDSKSGCWTPPVPPPPPPPYPPPSSSPADHGRSTFVTALIIAGAAVAFLVLCLSVFLFIRRRRQQQRQRQEALLEAALGPDGGGPGEEEGGGGGEEVVHHAWHIRTVGLDEAAIESIALTLYRAGAGGVLGASDCAVCLGEFADGELLRLLPKCAHAFHVPCIDTWLRAHVNCPLCRAHVLDPAAEQADGPPPATDTDAGAERGIGALEHEQPDRHDNEQRQLRVQIDQPSSSPPEQPHPHPGPRARNFQRMASMDSPSPVAPPDEAPADDQAGSEKRGTSGAVHCDISSDCQNNQRGMKRSLSAGSRWALVARHCRRPSSLLPL